MKKIFACYLVLLFTPILLRAQISNNTALVGDVLDATGGSVAGAKVTAVEQGPVRVWTVRYLAHNGSAR